MAGEQNRDRWRRYWDQTSPSYDKQMRFYERVLLGDSRSWVCGQAIGDTLEVAVGTGLNLSFYPAGVELTGIDFSPAMLGIAQSRARHLGRVVDLQRPTPMRCPSPMPASTPWCARSRCARSPTSAARSAR